MARSSLALALGSLLGSTALFMPMVASADPAAATVPDASSVKPMAPAAPTAAAPGASAPAAAAKPAAGAPSGEDAMRAQRRADRAAFFSAHIAALHAGLALRADQQALWPPVEAAIRDVGKAGAEMWKLHHRAMGDRDGKMDVPSGGADQIDALKMQGEAMTTMGNAMQGLAKATAPLLAGLSAEQKNRLPELIEGLKPRRLIARAFDVEDIGSRDAGFRDTGFMRQRTDQPSDEERGRGGDGGLTFDRGHRQDGGSEMSERFRKHGQEYGRYREGARGPDDGMSERHRSMPRNDD